MFVHIGNGSSLNYSLYYNSLVFKNFIELLKKYIKMDISDIIHELFN